MKPALGDPKGRKLGEWTSQSHEVLSTSSCFPPASARPSWKSEGRSASGGTNPDREESRVAREEQMKASSTRGKPKSVMKLDNWFQGPALTGLGKQQLFLILFPWQSWSATSSTRKTDSMSEIPQVCYMWLETYLDDFPNGQNADRGRWW